MPVHQVTLAAPPVIESSVPERGAAEAREQAVKQIERKRRFELRAVAAAVVCVFLVVVWAVPSTTTRAAGRRVGSAIARASPMFGTIGSSIR